MGRTCVLQKWETSGSKTLISCQSKATLMLHTRIWRGSGGMMAGHGTIIISRCLRHRDTFDSSRRAVAGTALIAEWQLRSGDCSSELCSPSPSPTPTPIPTPTPTPSRTRNLIQLSAALSAAKWRLILNWFCRPIATRWSTAIRIPDSRICKWLPSPHDHIQSISIPMPIPIPFPIPIFHTPYSTVEVDYGFSGPAVTKLRIEWSPDIQSFGSAEVYHMQCHYSIGAGNHKLNSIVWQGSRNVSIWAISVAPLYCVYLHFGKNITHNWHFQ